MHWSIFIPLLITAACVGYGLGERNARRSIEAAWQKHLETLERDYRA